MYRSAPLACIALVFVLGVSEPLRADQEELYLLMEELVTDHDRVRAARQDLESARRGIREARGEFFPELGVDTDHGGLRQINPRTNDVTRLFSNYDVSITQMLYDFGQTDAQVESARKGHDRAGVDLSSIRQTLLLEGVTAYVNVLRFHRQLAFARQSEQNIKRQTELEDARVEQGAGFSTDVLQAKTQLAGAEARRVQSEGALINAQTVFHALFRRFIPDPDGLELPPAPDVLLPRSLEDAIKIAVKENPGLASARLAADVARANLKQTRADEYFPRIQAVIENSVGMNADGTLGTATEQQARVELSFPFNLGFTSIDFVEGSRAALRAEEYRFGDARRGIEEQVRLAWQNLITARANSQILNNQANIAEQFLDLAREEREAGRRSLLDVLEGETNLINAQSDAVGAEADLSIAAFSVLSALGRLELSVFNP